MIGSFNNNLQPTLLYPITTEINRGNAGFLNIAGSDIIRNISNKMTTFKDIVNISMTCKFVHVTLKEPLEKGRLIEFFATIKKIIEFSFSNKYPIPSSKKLDYLAIARLNTNISRLHLNDILLELSKPIKTSREIYLALPSLSNTEKHYFYCKETTLLHSLVTDIVNQADDEKYTQLIKHFKIFLKSGIFVDLTDSLGFTALSYMVKELDLDKECRKNQKISEMIELLLNAGANPNPKNENDLNAAFYIFSCKFSNSNKDFLVMNKIFDLFITQRANPDAKCKKFAACHGLSKTPRSLLSKSSFAPLLPEKAKPTKEHKTNKKKKFLGIF